MGMIDTNRANKVIDFVQTLKHTGDFFGQPFILLDWQIEAIREVYGTTENGKRKYKMAYLEIPKKNGKTEVVAALAIFHLVCDPPGGQVVCAAAERDQASLVFNAAKDMISQSKVLSKLLKVKDSIKQIVNTSKHSTLKVLSSEAYSKHGLNPSVVIVDELHAHKKRDLWDTLTFGSGAARSEQLIWCITTAGDDPDRKSVAWEVHERAAKVMAGETEDPTLFAKIYCAPDDCDIYDEKNWYLANPSLGHTIDIEAVRLEAAQAKNSEASERLFRWLRLNQWVALKRIGWLPITLWDATEGSWNANELIGEECYVGVDLSTRTDLTGLALLFPPQHGHGWRFILDSYMPLDNIKEKSRTDHVPLDQWATHGYVNATPGDVVDYGYLAQRIVQHERRYKIKYFCADPWRVEYLRQLLPYASQQKFVEIPQSMAGMSAGMGELERLFRAHEIEHAHNPLGRWTFGNVVVAMDGNENIKPMKSKSIDRIDPIVALINAMAGAIRLEPKRSIYESRGMRMV